VARRIADAGGRLSHQLILTMPALALSEPPPLRSSEAEASTVIFGALSVSDWVASMLIDPVLASRVIVFALSVMRMPSSSISTFLPSLS
jgi:hypothetical protein